MELCQYLMMYGSLGGTGNAGPGGGDTRLLGSQPATLCAQEVGRGRRAVPMEWDVPADPRGSMQQSRAISQLLPNSWYLHMCTHLPVQLECPYWDSERLDSLCSWYSSPFCSSAKHSSGQSKRKVSGS